MKKITLKDSFRVSDSKVTGYVVIKENGKIIVKKENMIVEAGRKYIKDRIFGDSNLTIKKILFGNSAKVVESTDVLSTTFTNSTPTSIGSLDIVDDTEFSINKTADREVVYTVTITKDILGLTNDKSVSELGLVLSDSGDPEVLTLFSRLVFEPIPLTADHTYEIKYYIYF
jgi:hypothetical protein